MSMSSTQDGIGGNGGGIGEQANVGTGGEALSPLRGVRESSLSSILIPAVAMSGACLAVVTIAGAVKRGSPWAGVNAIAAGLGLTAVRPSRSFDPIVSLAGIGTAIGGAVVLAGLHHVVSRRMGGGRLLGGILTSVAAVTLDKVFMRDAIFPAFANALGLRGTVLKYGAMGAAAALASR